MDDHDSESPIDRDGDDPDPRNERDLIRRYGGGTPCLLGPDGGTPMDSADPTVSADPTDSNGPTDSDGPFGSTRPVDSDHQLSSADRTRNRVPPATRRTHRTDSGSFAAAVYGDAEVSVETYPEHETAPVTIELRVNDVQTLANVDRSEARAIAATLLAAADESRAG